MECVEHSPALISFFTFCVPDYTVHLVDIPRSTSTKQPAIPVIPAALPFIAQHCGKGEVMSQYSRQARECMLGILQWALGALLPHGRRAEVLQ